MTAFANGELTITLFDNGTLTGKVTPDTEIECDDDTAKSSGDGGDDDHGGRGGDDEGDDDHRGRGDDDDDEGDHHHGDHHGDHGDDDEACAPDALKVGAKVEEATLKISSAGRIWEEIELR